MKSPLPLFPSTVVGSMPRPQYVKDLLIAGRGTGAADPPWQRRMDDAVRFVIGMQERATHIGAGFQIDSESGLGTTIRVMLPAPKAGNGQK